MYAQAFAKVYDDIYSDLPYDAWAEYIANFLGERKTVLECGCGTGSVAIRLASRGYNVIAGDICEDMLQIAATKARNAGQAVQFINQDMTNIKLHKKVDAIVCVFDPVNMLNDSEFDAFLNCAKNTLKSGGILCFDCVTKTAFLDIYKVSCFTDEDYAVILTREVTDDGNYEVVSSVFTKQSGDLFVKNEQCFTYYVRSVLQMEKSAKLQGFASCEFFAHGTHEKDENAYRIQCVCKI